MTCSDVARYLVKKNVWCLLSAGISAFCTPLQRLMSWCVHWKLCITASVAIILFFVMHLASHPSQCVSPSTWRLWQFSDVLNEFFYESRRPSVIVFLARIDEALRSSAFGQRHFFLGLIFFIKLLQSFNSTFACVQQFFGGCSQPLSSCWHHAAGMGGIVVDYYRGWSYSWQWAGRGRASFR